MSVQTVARRLEHQQRLLDNSRNKLREAFVDHGMADDEEMDFKLVCRAGLNVSDDQHAEMWRPRPRPRRKRPQRRARRSVEQLH